MNKKKFIIFGIGAAVSVGLGVVIAKVIKAHNKTTHEIESKTLEADNRSCPYSSPLSCDFCEDKTACKDLNVRNQEISKASNSNE